MISARNKTKTLYGHCTKLQWALLNVQVITLPFTLTVQKCIYPPVSKVHAVFFRVSVIHQTLTWTTRSLTCVHDHSYVFVYTQGFGTLTASQHNIFDSEKLADFSCAPDGVRTSGHWILSPTLYQLSHPVTLCWSTMDAELKGSPGGSLGYQRCPPSKPGVGQNIALHAAPTDRNSTKLLQMVIQNFTCDSNIFISPWDDPSWLGTSSVYLCFCLCLCLSVCLSVSVSLSLSFSLSIYLSLYRSIYRRVILISVHHIYWYDVYNWYDMKRLDNINCTSVVRTSEQFDVLTGIGVTGSTVRCVSVIWSQRREERVWVWGWVNQILVLWKNACAKTPLLNCMLLFGLLELWCLFEKKQTCLLYI